MSNYLLTMDNKIKKISSIVLNNPYEVKSKVDEGHLLVYDKEFKANLSYKKFIKLYASYLKKLESFFDDNPDDSGFANLISEGDRLDSLLKNEFIKYLKRKDYNLLLEDLDRVNGTLLEEYQKFKRKNYRR